MGAAGLLATRTQAVGRPGWCSRVGQQIRLTEQQGPPDRRADQPLHTPVAPRSRVQQLRRCPAVARRPTVPLAARRRRPGRATGGRRTGGPINSAARRPSPRSPSNRCRRIGRAPPSSSLSLSTNSSARRGLLARVFAIDITCCRKCGGRSASCGGGGAGGLGMTCSLPEVARCRRAGHRAGAGEEAEVEPTVTSERSPCDRWKFDFGADTANAGSR